jgi:hypothetical protein
MIKIALKVFIGILINIVIIKSMYLNDVNRTANTTSYIKQVYSYEGFKYWSKVDGAKICGDHTKEEEQQSFKTFDEYTNSRTNIIYLQNVDLVGCKDQIQDLAKELHKRNIALALNIEKNFDYKDAFTDESLTKVKTDYYKNKFKGFEFVNLWVDYLVFDHAMEYLTYNDRRAIQTDLRKIFDKPFIGFRFTRHIDGFPTDNHPNRQNKTLEEFLPRDDDGDFIITSIYVPAFKRTLIFVEDIQTNLATVNGEFLKN